MKALSEASGSVDIDLLPREQLPPPPLELLLPLPLLRADPPNETNFFVGLVLFSGDAISNY
jgi:hypothetical protein